jgi:hypothetical protein
MKSRPASLAAIAVFAFALSRASAKDAGEIPTVDNKPAIGQSFTVELTQSAIVRKIREDGAANADNWMTLPAWWLPMDATAEWKIDIARILSFSLTPELAWRETGGSFTDGEFKELADQKQTPVFSLDRAEARLLIRDWGLHAVFGKLRPQFGVNYIAPLSVMNLRGRDEFDQGLWMGGLFWTIGDLSLESYCQTDPDAWADKDPVIIAAVNALFGIHEAGLLYRHEYGHNFGAWYRGQIGEGIIPYAECMLRQSGEFLDIAGLPSRAVDWNIDALAGIGYSPAELNLSCYLEYRFRQAGYRSADWEDLRGLSRPDQASAITGLSFLQSAVHSVGLHLRNADEIGGCFSWSLSCVYLAPDGLYADATANLLLFDRFSLGADIAYACLLGSDAATAASEIGLWPEKTKCTLYASWKMNAKE